MNVILCSSTAVFTLFKTKIVSLIISIKTLGSGEGNLPYLFRESTYPEVIQIHLEKKLKEIECKLKGAELCNSEIATGSCNEEAAVIQETF